MRQWGGHFLRMRQVGGQILRLWWAAVFAETHAEMGGEPSGGAAAGVGGFARPAGRRSYPVSEVQGGAAFGLCVSLILHRELPGMPHPFS